MKTLIILLTAFIISIPLFGQSEIYKHEIISDTLKPGLMYAFHNGNNPVGVWLEYPKDAGSWSFKAGSNETLADIWQTFNLDSKVRHTGYVNGIKTYECDTVIFFEARGIIRIEALSENIVYNVVRSKLIK